MKSKKIVWVLAAVAVVALVAFYFKRDYSVAQYLAKKQYQAVFLTSGQVYFGKLEAQDKYNLVLEDVYYLRASSELQADNEEDTDSEAELSLVKLGSEMHGPEGRMVITREHVLFWENLKADSKVVKAIEDFKSN